MTRHPASVVVTNCLRLGRAPCSAELEIVAAKIWHDVHPDAGPWRNVAQDDAAHRWALLAAEIALGGTPDADVVEPRVQPPSGEPREPLHLRWS